MQQCCISVKELLWQQLHLTEEVSWLLVVMPAKMREAIYLYLDIINMWQALQLYLSKFLELILALIF